MIHTGDIDKKGTIDIKKQSSPKSPYPPNSMSESVAHIVGNAGDINDLKEGLKQEIVDRKEGDQRLADDISSIEQAFPVLDEAIQNLEESDERLQSNIDAEKERATKRENEIEAKIVAGEKITDVKVDDTSVVKDKVAYIELQPIKASITAETKRAKETEQLIADSVNEYINETDEHLETLDDSVSSLTTSVDSLAKKEKADITGVAASIVAETSRAAAREDELEKAIGEAGKIDDVKVDGTSVVTDKVANIELSTKYMPLKGGAWDFTSDGSTIFDSSYGGLRICANTSSNEIPLLYRNGDKGILTWLYVWPVSRDTYNGKTWPAEHSGPVMLEFNNTVTPEQAEGGESLVLTDYLTGHDVGEYYVKRTVSSNGAFSTTWTPISEISDEINSAVSDEAAARKTADEALQTNIDAEATRAKEAEDKIIEDASSSFRAVNEEIEAINSSVESIEDKIPLQASSSNQLADKDYVNSSIATSTATFRGTVDSLDALKALTGDLNDYAFVEVKDETTGLTLRYDRYKYSGTSSAETGNWAFEYTLNNSSFTSDQWKAITSGITSDLVAQITENKDAIAQEITDREDAIYNVELNVDTEKYRAQREENDIRSNLDAEISRATSKETELEDAISKAGKVDDVQVNGTSVVTDKVANIDLTDYAKSSDLTSYVLKSGDTMTGTLNVPTIGGVSEITAAADSLVINAKRPRLVKINGALLNYNYQFPVLNPPDSALCTAGGNLTYNGKTLTLVVRNINSGSSSDVTTISTGTNAASYFQARKFRGQGDANTYNHAVDFGYAGHDRLDFYEYGGVFNFWANRGTTKLEGDGNRVASLQSGKILERGNTLTYPGKSGTFALTDDVTDGDAQTLTDAKAYSDDNYKQVFLRYSANEDGSGMTEKWQRGQKYIGTYVAHDASTDYKDYSWTQFVGDTYCETSTSTSVALTLADENDVSYTNDMSSLAITIPSSVYHGFYSGVNFKTGSAIPAITFSNSSSLPLKLVLRGLAIDTYTPKQNITCQMMFYCDGINVYCYMNEV